MRLPPLFFSRMLRRTADAPRRNPAPTRLRRGFFPVIGSLEPRLVLNATAELNALGQLVIGGDAAADVVQLEVNSTDQLLVRDAAGAIIPITGHPGNDTDPLDQSAITSGQLIIDLGGGDDSLNLQIPSSLNVTVVAGAGNDTTAFASPSIGTAIVGRTVDISSEQINIDSSAGLVDLRGASTLLTGNVIVGNANNPTTVQLDNGSLDVEGTFTLAGDLQVLGSQSQLDLSNAVLSASTTNDDLRIAFGIELGNDVKLGAADNSAGEFVRNLMVNQSNTVDVTANSFEVTGNLGFQNVTDTVRIDADVVAKDIVFDADLDVTVIGSLTANNGNIAIVSDNIVLSSPLLKSTGTQSYDGDVNFVSNGAISASQVSLGDSTSVTTNVTYTVNAPVIGNDLFKRGEGTLVLKADNAYVGETFLESGVLRIDGSTAIGAGAFHLNGGRLEGSGRIRSEVISANASTIDPGPRFGTLTVGGLNLAATSQVNLQFRNPVPGSGYDQLVVVGNGRDGAVQLGSAFLGLTFDSAAQAATEYLLVRNDGTDPIGGMFSTAFSISGALLQIPRVLNEGDLVLQDFGGSRRPAYITYAGGDGNDVAIVTAGDVNVRAGDVTLIQRHGSNLEIRVGNDLPSAQAATPTIRPIAAINDYQVRINGSPADQQLFVDLNDFNGTTPGAIQYTGNIVFAGGGASDSDRLTLLDLNAATNDIPASVHYAINDANNGVMKVVTHNPASQFNINFSQTETVVQSVAAPLVEFQYSGVDEQISVSGVKNFPGQTDVASTPSTGGMLNVNIVSPTSQLSILGGAGNDTITVTDSSSGDYVLGATLNIDGQAGNDTVNIQNIVKLGQGTATGNLIVNAESIIVSRDVNTTGGNVAGTVTFTGGRSIELLGQSTINVGDASIIMDAAGGTFNSGNGFLVSNNSAVAVKIENAAQVVLGGVTAPVGELRIETDSAPGGITQSQGSQIIADRLSIDSVGAVSLANANNGFRLIEKIIAQGDVAINDSPGDLEIVKINSSGNDVNITASNVLRLSTNAIVATGATVNIKAGDSILDNRTTRVGTMPNIIADAINLNGFSNNVGTAAKPLIIAAAKMVNATKSPAATAGNIFLSSPAVPLLIGRIDAGQGSVILDSVSIQDATADEVTDIIAKTLNMTSQTGIGSVRKLEIEDSIDVTAITTSGGIRFDHRSQADPVFKLLKADSGPIEVQHSGSAKSTINRIQSGNGNVSYIDQDGSIEVVGDGVSADAILAGASGSVTLTTEGDLRDITLKDSIRTSAGNVVLTAGQNVLFKSAGDIQTSSGSVFVTADSPTGNLSGIIQMDDGAVIDAATGKIALRADGNITIGSLQSQNVFADAISIETTSGKVIDGGDTNVNIIDNAGGANIKTLNGIGAGDAIETSLANLTAEVSGIGSLQINETDTIDLRSVTTNDGPITIVAAGDITATKVVSTYASNSKNLLPPTAPSRDILLQATGDIHIVSIEAMNNADVTLTAGDDVLDSRLTDSNRIVADDLLINAANRIADGTMAINVSTNVNDLVFAVTGTNPGDATINEFGSINLAASDSGSDADALQTSNGKITVIAGGDIVVRDNNPNNDHADRRGDVEISTSGDLGQISLTATGKIELAGMTQLEASQAIASSILIKADSVVLSDQIQLLTGNGIGIARDFSLRPRVGLADTAFFDFTTVTTDRLSQSGANDGLGTLSLLIGQPGEKGLTINIDWGDSANYRYQQIDNLTGDKTFERTHVYHEQDILNSTLNGRTSATAPLEVRFAVRQHESIVVQANSIQQGATATEQLTTGLASSSGNGSTDILLNGTAQFIIPNLTIPVAFYPVRQIIPEVVQPTVFVRVETSQFFANNKVESRPSSTSASVGRDEYFQIRILSLEPGGKDIAPPQRLPADILSGDKLKQLFAELPDGKYEIQYVLGDGNERTLLRVDIRNHQPIVPSEDIDGGQIELKTIDPEEILRELQEAEQEADPPTLPEAAEAIMPQRLSIAGRFIKQRNDQR